MLSSLRIFWSTNARIIGWGYLWMTGVYAFTGVLYSYWVRVELAGLGEQVHFGDAQYYNVMITAHAMLMIFWYIMPSLFSGFGNLILPSLLGVPEMVFPRINNLSLILQPIAYNFIIQAAICDEGSGTAWTIYPPLCAYTSHSGISVDYFIISLHLSGLSSCLSATNIIVTCVVARRCLGVMVHKSLYSWALLLTAGAILLVVPVLAAGITMILSDRNLNTNYFDVAAGGDTVLYQHLFWVFGHPEVYIIIMPVFGQICSALQREGQSEIFNRLGMIYAMWSIGSVGFYVWAHHMFVAGLDIDARTYFSGVTACIALPTALKLYSYVATLLRHYWGAIAVWQIYGFVVMFAMGGVTGIILANSECDAVLHDSYYVVAHFHYVLSMGALIGFVSGIFMVYSMVTGAVSAETEQRVLTGAVLLGGNVIFWPLHLTGLLGQPRRFGDHGDVYFGSSAQAWVGIIVAFVSGAILLGVAVDWALTLANIWSDITVAQTHQVVGVHLSRSHLGMAIATLYYGWVELRGPRTLRGGVTSDHVCRDYCITHLWVRDCCSPGSLVSQNDVTATPSGA